MTDYIVAIDLGTSHITGVVGEKHIDGTFSIIACEMENSASCIRRGNVYNLDSTATNVSNLIKKLENHLKGGYIDKVYVGVGGQSLRTIEHIETTEISEGRAITEEDINQLKEQCEKYKPDLLDVLDIAPAVYYLDGRRDTHPVGVPCKHFEAHYKLVVGRSSIRRDIINSIKDRAKKEVADIFVSPLALADAMLSKEEKELGCALIDFGGGVTSVAVYKNGDLLHMSVIPLGGNLITRDIASLQLTEIEAERIKKEYGSAVLQKEDDDEIIEVDMEGSSREIGVNDLNAVIEGRIKEIVENVYARISEVIELKLLGSGIVLTGCAAELKKLPELVSEKCKVKVRYSAIRSGLVRGSDNLLGNPLYMLAISLMLNGTKNCVYQPVKPESQILEDNTDIEKEKEEEEDSKKSGFFRRKKKTASTPGNNNETKQNPQKSSGWGFFGDIFKED